MTWNCTTQLLPHQVDAIAKVLPAKVGALFMEMGTGKSRVAIELARLRQAKIDRVIWFCPVSVRTTILAEIMRHTDVGIGDVHVFGDKTSESNMPPANWYIVGIESMSSSARVIHSAESLITDRSFVVLDESAYVKTPDALRTRRITLVSKPARYRLLLTGTPITQGIQDLWAQLNFLSPKILGFHSFRGFASRHLVYDKEFPGRVVDQIDVDKIAAKARPYAYQVLKEECLSLPHKTYRSRSFELSDEQAFEYERAKERLLTEDYLYGDAYQQQAVIYRLFTALQAIVCGFTVASGGEPSRSLECHRPDAAIGILKEIPDGELVVIWSRYLHCLRDLHRELSSTFGDDSVWSIHGGISPLERAKRIEAWKVRGRFLVVTQGVGGHGIDLTAAHRVLFYANSFQYGTRIQAEDRFHRIGQQSRVEYIDIWSRSGIEDLMARVLARKGNALAEFRRRVDEVRANGTRLSVVEKLRALL